MSSVTYVRDRDAALVGGGVCNDTGVKPTIGDLSSGDWVHTRGNESRHKINPLLFQWFRSPRSRDALSVPAFNSSSVGLSKISLCSKTRTVRRILRVAKIMYDKKGALITSYATLARI